MLTIHKIESGRTYPRNGSNNPNGLPIWRWLVKQDGVPVSGPLPTKREAEDFRDRFAKSGE